MGIVFSDGQNALSCPDNLAPHISLAASGRGEQVMDDHDGFLGLGGRIVVVSGAGGGGIGTTVTAMTARAGATVIAVSRSKETLDEHVAPLAQQGLAVVPVAADASTDEGIAAVIGQARRTDASLYGLVNVAGRAEPSTRVTRSDWRKVFADNLETAFFMSQAVAAELVAQRRPGRSCRSRRSAA
jgi:NAD(P)-dependent dehydrogenase (short-subunit alcohol dehydrogenase family)